MKAVASARQSLCFYSGLTITHSENDHVITIHRLLNKSLGTHSTPFEDRRTYFEAFNYFIELFPRIVYLGF